MSNYQKLISMKDKLQEIRQELNALKKLEPTHETGERIVEAEERIGEIRRAIRCLSKSYGFAA